MTPCTCLLSCAVMIGMLTADLSSGLWLLLATYLSLPVSTTHSIIGGIVGFCMAAGGGVCSAGWGVLPCWVCMRIWRSMVRGGDGKRVGD